MSGDGGPVDPGVAIGQPPMPPPRGAPQPLPPFPDSLEDGTQFRVALGAGALPSRPEKAAHRRGRLRRWYYTAAHDDRWLLAAAVVHLGLVGTAFVWLHDGERTWSWEHRGLSLRTSSRGPRVRRDPGRGAHYTSADTEVVVGRGGELSLRAELTADDGSRRHVRSRLLGLQGTPASLSTTTRLEGWNTTIKSAGHEVTGELVVREVAADGTLGPEPRTRSFQGLGFTDWTAGRQDRRTEWTWACGAGTAADGRRVGINASTGMNEHGPGEDVLWVDGVPYHLDVDDGWGPTSDDPAGPWRLAGPGWELVLEPTGTMRQHHDLRVVKSVYVAPIGTWRGALPMPDGSVQSVVLRGVAEEHEATW